MGGPVWEPFVLFGFTKLGTPYWVFGGICGTRSFRSSICVAHWGPRMGDWGGLCGDLLLFVYLLLLYTAGDPVW